MSLNETTLAMYCTGDSSETVTHASKMLLQQLLNHHSNKNEIKEICAKMGVDHENFPSDKTGFIREFILFLSRRKMIKELGDTLNAMSDFPFGSFMFYRVEFHFNVGPNTAKAYDAHQLEVFEKSIKASEELEDAPELVWHGQVETLWGYMNRRFSLQDLVTLCHYMNVDWDNFAGNKANRSHSLIKYFQNDNDKMVQMMQKCLIINPAFFNTD